MLGGLLDKNVCSVWRSESRLGSSVHHYIVRFEFESNGFRSTYRLGERSLKKNACFGW